MAFNTALSGLRAAQGDLSITGNNIANASTVGFKESRAEFSDLYAASISGVASRAVGNGTLLSNVGQQFSQGNISFTDNNLDLAINGNGFFMLDMAGAVQYSRSGIFGLDKDGFIVNNQGARLQGFEANDAGQIGGNLVDIRISTENQNPQATTEIDAVLNLNSEAAGDNPVAVNGLLPQFRATDPATYNHATSSTIYDSLGNSHVLSSYFIKDETAVVDTTIGAAAATINNGDIIVDGTPVAINGLVPTGSGAAADASQLATLINQQIVGVSASYDAATNSLRIATTDGSPVSLALAGTAAADVQAFMGGMAAGASSTATPSENTWQVYFQVDGNEIWDNDSDPSTAANQLRYQMTFNQDGSLNTLQQWDTSAATPSLIGSASILPSISVADWDPGSGAAITDFTIDFNGTTQYGSPFAVNGSSQNGYTTGRLVGVDISDDGTVLARYSNGQSTVLGGVALANFNNPQGLTPIGDNAWTESFDSGSPIIGSAGTASLGLVQSGALEDSNVDLSDELVNLILAQRNYQANAKTIETADSLTQTIINMR